MSYHVFDLAYHWSESILKQLETAATEAVVYSCTLHFIFSFFPSSGRGLSKVNLSGRSRLIYRLLSWRQRATDVEDDWMLIRVGGGAAACRACCCSARAQARRTSSRTCTRVFARAISRIERVRL